MKLNCYVNLVCRVVPVHVVAGGHADFTILLKWPSKKEEERWKWSQGGSSTVL